jgi:peptidoglycan/xylan/chitin deacetylase (PgdA/CDA1 family)
VLTAVSRNWHVTIGAHTVGNHDHTRLSATELAHELSESRHALEARLDKEVRHFAYPFGGRDAAGQREFEAALEADFATAVTTRCANLFKEHAWHLMSLPRLGMDGNYPALLLLERLENGLVPARGNGWKRVVTV